MCTSVCLILGKFTLLTRQSVVTIAPAL